MPKAVFNSSILVSAFLKESGISRQLLHQAEEGIFHLCLAPQILDETRRVLLQYLRIRKRHPYSDEDVLEYVDLLGIVSQLVTDLPRIKVLASDPADDIIVACAVQAGARYLVTRDKDLLALGHHHGQTNIVSPEEFMALLRKQLRGR